MAIGRLAKVQDASGETSYSYNHRGQVMSKVYQVGERRYKTTNQYDAVGRLASSQYPSGRTVSFDHKGGDILAMTTQAFGEKDSQTVVSDLDYSGITGFNSFKYGNGLTLDKTRDGDARLISQTIHNAANDAIYAHSYQYDRAGNILAIDDGITGTGNEQFTYDVLHRLTTASGIYGQVSYGFDGVGNRQYREINTPEEGSEVLEKYRYDDGSNRLVAVDSSTQQRSLDYDKVGNIVTDNRRSASEENRALIYGASNRLQGVKTDEYAAKYVYNAKGQRVVASHFTVVRFP